jgi:hypothetical protein
VSNGSQTLQRGQLGRLCLPDVVLLGHWDMRVSGEWMGDGKRKQQQKITKFSMKL